MRVLLMPSAYLPDIGGVEVVTRELALQLRASEHEVQVWTGRSPDGDLPQHEVIDGLMVRRFVYPAPRAAVGSLLAWPTAALATLRQMSRALRDFRPDVINVHCFSSNGAYATALSRWANVPLVVSLHGETITDDHQIYDKSVFLRTALRWGLRRAKAVTGCSQFVLDDAQARFGLPAGKGLVVFNGVELRETEARPPAVPFKRYFLGVGRLVHNKGFDLLIDAFAEIPVNVRQGVGVVLVGGGPELPALRAHAERAGVADLVHFTGWLDRDEVVGAYRSALGVVVPSRVESFGVVVVEAWREAAPVIASVRGGTREFVEHAVTGLIVDPLNRDELRSALELLLTSADIRARLGEAGRVASQRFSRAALGSQYFEALNS